MLGAGDISLGQWWPSPQDDENPSNGPRGLILPPTWPLGDWGPLVLLCNTQNPKMQEPERVSLAPFSR